MLKMISLYKVFSVSILLTTFLIYFTGSSVLAYSPLIFLILIVIFFEFLTGFKIKDKFSVLLWLPYVFLATLYYFLNPYDGSYLTAYFFIIFALPLMVLYFVRIENSVNNSKNINFNFNLMFFFVFIQFVICVGQVSTYMTGVGFPVSEIYKQYFVVSGSFNNPNDLAAVVLLIGFSFIFYERKVGFNRRFFTWFMIFFIVLITGSRSVILTMLFLFLFFRGLSFKNILLYVVVLSFISFLYGYFLTLQDNDVLSRVFLRINSLVTVFNEGLSVDGSMSLRLDSYLHFIKKINYLGLGSGEIGNYFVFSNDARFSRNLVFENPHSLIVEVGYWLGFLGLIFFITPLVFLLKYSRYKTLLVFVFLISSSISSSVLDSFVYFYFLFLCFFMSKKYYTDINFIGNYNRDIKCIKSPTSRPPTPATTRASS